MGCLATPMNAETSRLDGGGRSRALPTVHWEALPCLCLPRPGCLHCMMTLCLRAVLRGLRRIDSEMSEELTLASVHFVHTEEGMPAPQLRRLMSRMPHRAGENATRRSVDIIGGD